MGETTTPIIDIPIGDPLKFYSISGKCGISNIINNSTIYDGIFSGNNFTNNGRIEGGIFNGSVINSADYLENKGIYAGIFTNEVLFNTHSTTVGDSNIGTTILNSVKLTADGVTVTNGTGTEFDGFTDYIELNGGSFSGFPASATKLYFKAGMDQYWGTVGNWWSNPDGTGSNPEWNAPWTTDDATKDMYLSMVKGETTYPIIGSFAYIGNGFTITGICNIPNITNNSDGIYGGTFTGVGFINNTYINGGTFTGVGFINNTYINGGTFSGDGFINNSVINGGTFSGDGLINNSVINGGAFSGSVTNSADYSFVYGILCGTFTGNILFDTYNTTLGDPFSFNDTIVDGIELTADGVTVIKGNNVSNIDTTYNEINGGSFAGFVPVTHWYFKAGMDNNWITAGNWWSKSDGTGINPVNAPWTANDENITTDLSMVVGETTYPIISFMTFIGDMYDSWTITGTCDIPYIINCGNIYSGTFTGDYFKNGDTMVGNGYIYNGTFYCMHLENTQGSYIYGGNINSQEVDNTGYINGGIFTGTVTYNTDISYVSNGTYTGTLILNNNGVNGGDLRCILIISILNQIYDTSLANLRGIQLLDSIVFTKEKGINGSGILGMI
jgi:hypothetical protein